MQSITTAKLLRWGNSYGLRLSKRDVERLGLHPGRTIDVSLVTEDDRIDAPHFTFSDPDFDCLDHDKELYGWHSDG